MISQIVKAAITNKQIAILIDAVSLNQVFTYSTTNYSSDNKDIKIISADWSQDKFNQCSTFPGSITGYTSWSLVCKDESNQRTSCSEYIDRTYWKSNPSIVTNTTYQTGE